MERAMTLPPPSSIPSTVTGVLLAATGVWGLWLDGVPIAQIARPQIDGIRHIFLSSCARSVHTGPTSKRIAHFGRNALPMADPDR
jgi:hypothetical protein